MTIVPLSKRAVQAYISLFMPLPQETQQNSIAIDPFFSLSTILFTLVSDHNTSTLPSGIGLSLKTCDFTFLPFCTTLNFFKSHFCLSST